MFTCNREEVVILSMTSIIKYLFIRWKRYESKHDFYYFGDFKASTVHIVCVCECT